MRAILTAAALLSTALLATACHDTKTDTATNEIAPVVDEGNAVDATNDAMMMSPDANATSADDNATATEGNASAPAGKITPLKKVPNKAPEDQQSSGGVVLKN